MAPKLRRPASSLWQAIEVGLRPGHAEAFLVMVSKMLHSLAPRFTTFSQEDALALFLLFDLSIPPSHLLDTLIILHLAVADPMLGGAPKSSTPGSHQCQTALEDTSVIQVNILSPEFAHRCPVRREFALVSGPCRRCRTNCSEPTCSCITHLLILLTML